MKKTGKHNRGWLGRGLTAAAFCVASTNALATMAFMIDEFTGDDAQMYVNVTTTDPGVVINTGFTTASANTGDITGFWVGIDDSAFNPAAILESHISLSGLPSGVTYSVDLSGVLDLGGGVQLTGENGFAVAFDLDIGLSQNDDLGGNDIIDSLTINVATPGLLETHLDAFGARLQSVGDDQEGSSKLAGSGGTFIPDDPGSDIPLPVPGPVALLGLGGLMLGWQMKRKSRA